MKDPVLKLPPRYAFNSPLLAYNNKLHTIYRQTNVFVLVLYAKQQQKNP
jgi:hypothetical protein